MNSPSQDDLNARQSRIEGMLEMLHLAEEQENSSLATTIALKLAEDAPQHPSIQKYLPKTNPPPPVD